uniref:Transposase n=1 Tax=Macrostomum lignano TaxID=282301 RepID=A0A1I8FRI5_9PLAT
MAAESWGAAMHALRALKLCQIRRVQSAELAGLTVGKDATAASNASSSLT